MAFLDENFLLKTPAARILYHDYAADMPILDYHCHLSPKEIYENRSFSNIAQVWLGGDHYKWRLLRAGGVEEKYITGDASDREKFQKYAEVLSRAIGNPLYHWSHLELKRYFGFDGVLGPDTAQQVWDLCGEKLQGEDMRARALIERSNVKLVCTTDDPADDLRYHRLLAADAGFSVRVLPASGSLPGADRTPGIRVVDTQVGTLPKAGAAGVYPYLAVAACLLGLAGACAWRRREWARAS